MADVAEVLAKYPVIVRQPIVWGDMDSYRHVNNVVYFRYFENARLEYFKQKTAYEIRIRDWSSDVCSSDLHDHRILGQHLGHVSHWSAPVP